MLKRDLKVGVYLRYRVPEVASGTGDIHIRRQCQGVEGLAQRRFDWSRELVERQLTVQFSRLRFGRGETSC